MLKIKNTILEIHSTFLKFNSFKLILLGVFINIILSFLFHIVSDVILNINLNTGFKKLSSSIYKEFMLAVIVVPIFETLIFQYGIIETIKKKFNPFICAFTSAFFFGITHPYNIFYFFFAFFVGLAFAYLYYVAKSTMRAVLIILSIHVIYNLIVFIMKHIFP